MNAAHHATEKLNAELNNSEKLREYKATYDDYRPSFLPRALGTFLVWAGNIVYGHQPSYLKFRAVEVIARVPYHSWSSAAFTWLTIFYTDEKNAMKYSKIAHFSEHAQENETMHVVVISQLAKGRERAGAFRHTFIPMLFAFFYFWMSYFLYIINTRYSYELNYMFENHAFEQYNEFLEMNANVLKDTKLESEFLTWYGRQFDNHYDFFVSVRNDEIIHRNQSIEEIERLRAEKTAV